MKVAASTLAPKFTWIRGTFFPASPDGLDPQRALMLKKCDKRHRQLARKMVSAAASHDEAQQMKVVREWKSCSLVRIWAGVEVNLGLPGRKRLTLQEVEAQTKALFLDKAIQEVVIARRKAKPCGDFRYYCEFGFRHKVLHVIMRELYTPFLVPKPFQYEFKRRGKLAGVQLAIKEIRNAILAGYVHFAHLDIISCYASFKEEEQKNIVPGLRRVTIHNTGGHLNIVPKGPHYSLSHILSEARRGAPQGSALSALLAAIIVSRLEWKSDTLIFNWADNFLILGSSKTAVEQAIKALVSQVAELPGGDFALSLKEKGHSGRGFEFLGHRIAFAND